MSRDKDTPSVSLYIGEFRDHRDRKIKMFFGDRYRKSIVISFCGFKVNGFNGSILEYWSNYYLHHDTSVEEIAEILMIYTITIDNNIVFNPEIRLVRR